MPKYSRDNPRHQALFSLNNEQLRRKHNLSDEDIRQLRSVQRGEVQPDEETPAAAASVAPEPAERAVPRREKA